MERVRVERVREESILEKRSLKQFCVDVCVDTLNHKSGNQVPMLAILDVVILHS